MKLYKQIIFILIIFFKTGNLLSENNLFNVNNIELEKKVKTPNKTLANQAIKSAFDQLVKKILLKEDSKKLSGMDISLIKELVMYYQVSDISKKKEGNKEFVNFNVTFDKDKIHNLFFEKRISYADISDKELNVLPILIKDNEIYIFNNNFFYNNWNEIYSSNLIDFILPLENIEIIQEINKNRNNLLNIQNKKIFSEFKNKNTALIFIEDSKDKNKRAYLNANIESKNISKSIIFKDHDLSLQELNKKIILETKRELINLIKLENLIDIGTPSFINVKLNINRKKNLKELNSRIKNIDLIENIFVQEFNKDHVKLKIKYLGNLDKMMKKLQNKNINLELINDQWIITSL